MKRKSYIWMICLLVFVLIGVGVFFAVRRAATSGVIPVLTNVPVESLETPAVTPEPAPSAEIIVEQGVIAHVAVALEGEFAVHEAHRKTTVGGLDALVDNEHVAVAHPVVYHRNPLHPCKEGRRGVPYKFFVEVKRNVHEIFRGGRKPRVDLGELDIFGHGSD